VECFGAAKTDADSVLADESMPENHKLGICLPVPYICAVITLITISIILKLVVCILLRVLGQVQGFRLTQHWFEYFIQ
jgi:hypothetical protein